MMNLLPPVDWSEVATKSDLRDLEASIDVKLAQFRSELLRTMGTWLFASQAAVVALVGALVTVLVALT